MSTEDTDTPSMPAPITKSEAPEREETMETEAEEAVESIDPAAPRLMPKFISDEEALKRAKEHMKNDQVLVASRLLKQMTKIPDEETTTFQKEVEFKTKLLEGIIADLLTDPSSDSDGVDVDNDVDVDDDDNSSKWLKMGESHDEHRDTVSYYQLSDDLQLKCRIETPIESSLLVPLLSVLIETDLFTTWLPKWTVPRIGLGSVTKLAQMGRTEQIVHFISEVPWPFTARDCILQTCATDDIHDLEGPTTGTIVIGLHSLEGGEQVPKSTVCNEHYMETAPEVVDIPFVDETIMKRATLEGGLLIRKCPKDHVSLQGSTIEYPKDEHLILVGFSMEMDGKISPMFPQTIINFVIQTAIVQMWAMFLKVAEEIRDGSRPQHAEAIAAKREEIYNWVDERIEAMFANLQEEEEEENKKTNADDVGNEETNQEEKKDESQSQQSPATTTTAS